jgi:hypothetical protein
MQQGADYYLTPFEADSLVRDLKMIDIEEYGSPE